MQDNSSVYFSGIAAASEVAFAGTRDIARHVSIFAGSKLNDLLACRVKIPFDAHLLSRFRRQEVAITYAGRTGQFLMMTSERVMIPAGNHTVGKLLCNLYRRGDRWVEALDDSRMMCTVNGREATLFDPLVPGAAICLSIADNATNVRI